MEAVVEVGREGGEGGREGGVGGRGRIFPCLEVGRYGCQSDGLREADTVVRKVGREGREGRREGKIMLGPNVREEQPIHLPVLPSSLPQAQTTHPALAPLLARLSHLFSLSSLLEESAGLLESGFAVPGQLQLAREVRREGGREGGRAEKMFFSSLIFLEEIDLEMKLFFSPFLPSLPPSLPPSLSEG
jgi:hypothetical protein